MVAFVAKQFGEDGTELRSFYACRYDGGALPTLPWGSAEFDCVLVCLDPDRSRQLAGSFSVEIVTHAIDYVQTTSVHAEWLHDRVDEAAVAAGLQEQVGDGMPMTAWHEDAVTLPQIIEVAIDCLGSADQVLCLVVGRDSDVAEFAAELRRRLEERE